MKSILIVEDNLEILDSLKTVLETSGFLVFQATDGKQALEMLNFMKLRNSDIILLTDLKMPIMSGEELIAAVLKDPILCEISILAMTACRVESRNIPTNIAVLQKPFELDDLFSILNETLNSGPIPEDQVKMEAA